MKFGKLYLPLLLSAVLLWGCTVDAPAPSQNTSASSSQASAPVAVAEPEIAPAGVAEALADYAGYGSFEAAMEASHITVRARAGETLGMQEIACGIDGSVTTEYQVNRFTVLEVLKGALPESGWLEVYQGPGNACSGPPLIFAEGEEFVLCLTLQGERLSLLNPFEGAYTIDENGAYVAYGGGFETEIYLLDDWEWEISVEALPPLDYGPIEFEIVDIQGPFPIPEEDRGSLLLEPTSGTGVPGAEGEKED